MRWIAIAIGAFYCLGGIAVLRRMPLDRVMNFALQALGEKPDARERLQVHLLLLGGCLTFASGLALVTLSTWATAVFASNSLFQAGYLIWAMRVVPSRTEGERRGRNRTINAFIIYLAALAFVTHAQGQGVFAPWPIGNGAWSGIIEPLAIGGATVVLWTYWYTRLRGMGAENTRTGKSPVNSEKSGPGLSS